MVTVNGSNGALPEDSVSLVKYLSKLTQHMGVAWETLSISDIALQSTVCTCSITLEEEPMRLGPHLDIGHRVFEATGPGHIKSNNIRVSMCRTDPAIP
jgi:hypothetical protein